MPARKKAYPPYEMVERAVLLEYDDAQRRLARERARTRGALQTIPDLRRVTDPSWTAAKARLESEDAGLHRTEKENERRLALCLYGLRLRLCPGERKAYLWASEPLRMSADAAKKYVQRKGGRAEAKKLAARVLRPLTGRPGLVLRVNPFSTKLTARPKPPTMLQIIEMRERAPLWPKRNRDISDRLNAPRCPR